MEITQEDIKAQLMQSNEEFRQLVQQHSELKKRVMDLEAKSHPSLDEQLEEAKLKKQKLHLKDAMAEMISRQRLQEVV
ncbi:MAG: DUF465 domain-containing protein [Candidatus Solibacter usitatus]|nr:DUF465 domain-containing protein [Candidatus Solibacter usitatus]